MARCRTLLAGLVLSIVACVEPLPPNEPGGRGGETHWITVDGAVQKGPFIVGSSIFAAILDDIGRAIGKTFSTKTSNDLGEFALDINLGDAASVPVALEGSGFYFNEATAELSQAYLTLRAIGELTRNEEQRLYVNLVTHLTFDRVKTLLDQGLSYTAAIIQAERELVIALRAGPNNFVLDRLGNQLNFVGGGDHSDAYSLTLSGLFTAMWDAEGLVGAQRDAAMQERLNRIQLDLADDGLITKSLIDLLEQTERQVDPNRIAANLRNRLIDIGTDTEIANINLIWDSDGDGWANADDNCRDIPNDQTDSDRDGVGDACDYPVVAVANHCGEEVFACEGLEISCAVFADSAIGLRCVRIEQISTQLFNDNRWGKPTVKDFIENPGISHSGAYTAVALRRREAAEYDHCALGIDRKISCWKGFFGQPRLDVPSGDFIDLLDTAANGAMYHAQASDGSVVSWSWDDRTGDDVLRSLRTAPPVGTTVAEARVGGGYVCWRTSGANRLACTDDHAVLAPNIAFRAFDISDVNRLPVGCGIANDDGRAICWAGTTDDPDALPVLLPLETTRRGPFEDIDVFGLYACGLRRGTRHAECWKHHHHASDANATNQQQIFPTTDVAFKQLSTAYYWRTGEALFGCGATVDGNLHCWSRFDVFRNEY